MLDDSGGAVLTDLDVGTGHPSGRVLVQARDDAVLDHRGHRGGVRIRGVIHALGVGVGGCVGREGGILVGASGP